MNRTKIPWATHVWNPVTGCSPASEGCDHCYAKAISRRFGWKWGHPQFHPERLSDPLKMKKPARIFVCSMSDLFHAETIVAAQSGVWDVARVSPQHTFIILTKRPENMRRILRDSNFFGAGVLPNVWLGVSVENQARADERIPIFLSMPAAVRWVSFEPLLSPIKSWPGSIGFGLPQWIVAGPETGPHARPCDPAWIQSLADQCQASGVPFFDKRANPIRRELPL